MTNFLNLILEPLQEVFFRIKGFLPNLLAMLVILIIGILAGKDTPRNPRNFWKAIT
jgi:hypothetical protein